MWAIVALAICPSGARAQGCLSGSFAPGMVGQPYSSVVNASCACCYCGGFDPWTISCVGNVPPGLRCEAFYSPYYSLFPDTELTGTPTAAGTYCFQIQYCPNYCGIGYCGCGICINEQRCVTIACPAFTFTPPPPALADAPLGLPYLVQLSVLGGGPPHVFTLVAGALPPGLTLSPSGAIGGRPTQIGLFAFTIRATDTGGCTGSVDYTLAVCSAASMGPGSLPEGAVGRDYEVQLTVTGGTPPHQFQAIGPLPPGLTLAANGLLSGRPSGIGSYGLTAEATDSGGCRVRRSYVLDVRAGETLLAGRGPGAPNDNRVRAFDVATQSVRLDLLAYGAGAWGANVAASDVVGDPHDRLLTGPGPGPVLGPHVRGFDRLGASLPGLSYFAYATLKFGVGVAGGRLDGADRDTIVTGPGWGGGFGPHVRGWTYDGQQVAAVAKISFFAYGTVGFGVNAAAGDVDGDAMDEILTGPGPGPSFGPTVRGFQVDGGPVIAIAKINFDAFALTYGANVAGADVDDDTTDEILAAAGAGPANPARIRGFDYDGSAVALLQGFETTPYGSVFGARVGGGGVDADARDDVVTGAGPDPAAAATVHAYRYGWFGLKRIPASFDAFSPAGYGVAVAVGALGL